MATTVAKSRQRHTAEAMVDAFNRMDIEAIVSYRAPECMRFMLPSSIGLEPMDNEQYRASLLRLKGIFTNFSLDVKDVVEDKDAHKISMWLVARADTLAGQYDNEYMWTMQFDQTGDNITQMVEFVDAGTYRDFWPKLRAAMVEQSQR